MSGGKIVLWVVIAAVILGGLYYWFTMRGNPASAPAATNTTATTTPQVAQGPTLPSGSDTSDAAIQQDLSSTDGDTNAFASDNASIDSGMNDKEVPQQ